MQFLTWQKNIKGTSHPETLSSFTHFTHGTSQIVMSYIPCAYKWKFEEIEESKSTKNILLKTYLGVMWGKYKNLSFYCLLGLKMRNASPLSEVKQTNNTYINLNFYLFYFYVFEWTKEAYCKILLQLKKWHFYCNVF